MISSNFYFRPFNHHRRRDSLILFLIYIFTFSIFLHPVNASNSPDISISSNSLSFEITSGQIQKTYLEIGNDGSEELHFNISYSTNLELDENTVGLWHFNEGSGHGAHDETSYQNDGSISGAEWSDGKFGGALGFDGIDDYVLVPNSPSLNVESITMEAWIMLRSVEQWSPIGGMKYLGYGLQYGEWDQFRAHVWGGGLKWYETPFHLDLGRWYYIAMTFDASTGELVCYVDGMKVDERFEGSDPINYSNSNLVFGRGWTETMWNLFNGKMDEIRISNRARSENELYINYRRALYGEGEWLQFSQSSGKVAPGSIFKLGLTLDASELNQGTYEREIIILSNDPDEHYISVPVTLEVSPAQHDLAIINVIAPLEGEAESPINVRAAVSNQGEYKEIDVKVSLIADGEIVDSRFINSLSSGEEVEVRLKWTPKLSGEYTLKVHVSPALGENILDNNNKKTIIIITGYPDIHIDKESLEFQMDKGEIERIILKISNIGASDLVYLITDSYDPMEFFDDMEHGVGGWSHEGVFDSWELGEPEAGPETSYSGCYCWGTDLDENYPESSDSFLVSPKIDLKNRIHPQLSFSHWYSIDSFGDHCYVDIWDGSTWHTLNPEGYDGYSGGWVNESYDLSSFTGKKIKIRFRLVADEDYQDKGWFIDDMSIVDLSGAPGDWLMESPHSGYIPPHSYQNITITIDTKGLVDGIKQESILIRSNDPDEDFLHLPINITVGSQYDETPPIADAGPDLIVEEDVPVLLDGSNSTDNVGISNHTWSFIDRSIQTLIGEKVTYLFETPGVYQITLIVTDHTGNNASDNLKVTVLDRTRPSADAGEDMIVEVGIPIEFDGGNSSDNVGIISYQWDFGNGTTAIGIRVTHTFSQAGKFNVTLMVEDYEGNKAIDWLIVRVEGPVQEEITEGVSENETGSAISGDTEGSETDVLKSGTEEEPGTSTVKSTIPMIAIGSLFSITIMVLILFFRFVVLIHRSK